LPRIPGYEILGELGRGGMGVVYKARQVSLNRMTALKVLLGGEHAGLEEMARFRAEAEAAAALRHPQIVQVYEVGTQDGFPYFAMEFVAGGSLRERLPGQAPPARAAAQLVETLAREVHFAHRRGVVHRDLKPANILLEEPPQGDAAGPFAAPKVADFGLAKGLDDVRRTLTGRVLGTPSYMAPEQAAGKSKQVGPPADVYALGAILFELLTGRPPFVADSAETLLVCVVRDDPVPPRRLQLGCPPDLETICLKCLEKEPARRYPTAEALAHDLACFRAGRPITARPPLLLYRWRKFAARNKALVGGVAATAALVLGFIVSVFFALGEARQRRQAEADRRSALRQAYQARLAAAQAALGENNLQEAGQHLEGAPQELRGWECRHLRQRLADQSPAVVPNRNPDFVCWGFFPAGRGLVARSQRRSRLVDTRTGAVLRRLPDGVGAWVCSTRAGPLLVIHASDGGPLCLADGTGKVRRTDRSFGADLNQVAVSPTGTRAIAGYRPHALGAPFGRHYFMDWPSERLWLIHLPSRKPRARLPVPAGKPVDGPTFSPDGKRVAAGGANGTVRLWDAATGTDAGVFRGHAAGATRVAFSPDGRRLASGSFDRTVREWDLRTGRPLNKRVGHKGTVWGLAYSPDGRWLASDGEDFTVRVWRSDGGEAVAVLGHPNLVHRVAFSADGREIAAISADNEARVWPTPSLAGLRVLRHTSYVYALAYSPDGRWLASGGWDNKLHLWDAA
jgi:tRNA A-37 threonylcarbamoyl transferase component Bud32